MGKGSKPIIGYHYRPAYHHGLTTGPIDAFLEFRVGDRTAWRGRLEASGTISINAPNLLGGEKDQGGVVGELDVMFGEATQMPNSYLTTAFGDKQPAWRGFTTVVWKGGRYGAMNPYPKPASYKVERILQGWDGGTAWYPAKAVIPMIDGFITLLGEGWEYVVEPFSEPNTVWSDFTVPAAGWAMGGEMPFSTDGAAGGAYWTPMRSNIWLRRQMSVTAVGLTLNIGADNGCVVWVDGVNVGSSNPTNESLPSNEENPVSFSFAATGTVEVVVKAFAEIDSADDGGNIVDLEFTGAPLNAANPAHVLYEARTCADMGREPTANINEASLTAGADTLYAEGFGICTKWDPASQSVADFENRICRVIGGSYNRSIEDGQFYLDLARGDYVLEDLPILTDDDILEFREQPSTLDSAINSVSVRYFDPERKESIVTPPVRALGLVAAFGTIHQTFDFPEIPTGGLATRVAQRELLATSTPTRTFDLVTTRRTYGWRPNTYFRLQSVKRGIADMVCLVGEKNSGSLRSGAIKMKATQDIYSLPQTSFVEVEHGVDPTPNQTPTAITLQRAIEAPYIEVVAAMPRAELAALPADAGFALGMAATTTTDLDFTMMVSADGVDYDEVGGGEWCASATVVEAAVLDGALQTAFTLADGTRLDLVEEGMAALWEDELCRVDTFDADTGAITLGRACGDTVPAEHAAGSRIYFYQTGYAYDTTEYTDGETIDVKLLSNTGSEQLAIASATAMPLTFDQRAARPYPPGQFRINAVPYPVEVAGGPVTVSWVHRDRQLQADQLLDTDDAGVGPEAGTTYSIAYYQPADTQVHSETAIAGTAGTPYTFPGTGPSRITLHSERDALASWQAHDITFEYGAAALSIDNLMAAGTVYIAHRGASLRYPEQTSAAYAGCAADGFVAVEQDLRVNADGTMVVSHDASASYVSTSAANYSTLTEANIAALTVDASAWFGVSYATNVALWSAVLASYKTNFVFFPEIKEADSGATVAALQAAGIPGYQALVSSFTASHLAGAVSAGYRTMLASDSADVLATASAAGIDYVVYNRTAPAARFTDAVAAGVPVFAYTVNRRKDRDTLLGYGVSGIYTDDPEYLAADTPFSTTDNFSAQDWQPGMLASYADGSDESRPTADRRGKFYSTAYWGYDDNGVTPYRGCLMGHMCPIGGNASNDTFTIDLKVTFGAPSDANQARWASVAIAATDQAFRDDVNGTPNPNSYHFLFRKNGTIAIYKRDSTAGTLLVQDTSGAAIGNDTEHRFKVIVTPTQLKIERLNSSGTVIQSVTSSDTSAGYRGGYFHLGHSMLPVKFRDISVS